MIHRSHNASASHRLQLRDQYADRLQGFSAEATFRCELMRCDRSLVHLIDQVLTERLEIMKRLVENG